MTGIFINSENLSHFEIKKQIRSLTNSYDIDLLIDLYNEFNSFSVWEIMKINSSTIKINELEFKSNYIKEEGLIVDFFPKKEYKIVSGIIRYVGYEEFRLNNLNFDDYQNFLNLTFDFSYCFTEIVKSINQKNVAFKGAMEHNGIDDLGRTQSSIDFFRNVNKNSVSELDITNFIDEKTKNDLSKLELLKNDLEDFEVNFISAEVVESIMSEKIDNSKSISDLFDKFKGIVIKKIGVAKTLIPQHSDDVKLDEIYKKQNLFKVGLLFATGEMNKYFTINSLNEIILKDSLSPFKIAKELGNPSFEKIILASKNNYPTDNSNGNKNIFNNSDMMTKIIEHCKSDNLKIDSYFLSRLPSE